MFGPIKNVIFDFDGTLVDTMTSVIEGLSQAVRFGRGGASITREELVGSFGGTPLGIVQRWVPEDKVNEAFKVWLDFENSLQPQDMAPFPGIEGLLKGLLEENIATAIYTGRDRKGTLKIAEAHGWMGKFLNEQEMVCGDDGFSPKPCPDPILHLLKKFNWNPKETLMVGDHPFDMKAGRDAGVRTGAVLWDKPFGTKGTQRSIFKQVWEKWDGNTDVDVRLEKPEALLNWIRS